MERDPLLLAIGKALKAALGDFCAVENLSKEALGSEPIAEIRVWMVLQVKNEDVGIHQQRGKGMGGLPP